MKFTYAKRAALVVAGCTVAAALAVAPSMANVPPSVFQSDDGNTAADGGQDWAAPAPAEVNVNDPDTASGPNDESFTQGTKSDSAVPTVETGSIPPNKSDLTRMRVATETINNDVFLYIAWERSNTLGSANMNFEFDASDTLSANGITPVRSPGDVLITFDFANGGNHVDLGLSRWGSTQCEASGGKAPCWGTLADLDQAGIAEGSVSEDGKFGEAAINLTDAGVTFESSCAALGSVYLTSRSSASFTAALKDFVPPASMSLAECGAIKIVKTAKHFAGAGANLAASFDVKLGSDVVATVSTNGTSGTVCVPGLPFDTYTVDEVSGQTGYALDPDVETVVVDTASDGCGSSDAFEIASFENKPLSNITVSFTSQVTGGTAADISCTGLTPSTADGTPGAFDDTSETFTDLEEGTYTCTIVIDP